MELRTLLVNLDVEGYSSELLAAAVDLAARFGARVSAVAAASVQAGFVTAEGAAVAAGIYDAERRNLDERLADIEREFRSAVPERLRGNCLTMIDLPTPVLTLAARRADLVMARSGKGVAGPGGLDAGEVLLSAGRPMLLAGKGHAAIKAENILVAWKEGRESRRAIVDALPLLKRAASVSVVTIHEEGDRLEQKNALEDVVAWLKTHDVKAEFGLHAPRGTYSDTLAVLARDAAADLIVSGAYGRGRVREWMFGGATRDLLAAAELNRFMSN